jgi:hypothetical protein
MSFSSDGEVPGGLEVTPGAGMQRQRRDRHFFRNERIRKWAAFRRYVRVKTLEPRPLLGETPRQQVRDVFRHVLAHNNDEVSARRKPRPACEPTTGS